LRKRKDSTQRAQINTKVHDPHPERTQGKKSGGPEKSIQDRQAEHEETRIKKEKMREKGDGGRRTEDRGRGDCFNTKVTKKTKEKRKGEFLSVEYPSGTRLNLRNTLRVPRIKSWGRRRNN
jgi:hypothetical protein